jgi:hypothetical protein
MRVIFMASFSCVAVYQTVERDSYLLELSRHVVLNPVRAAMVREIPRAQRKALAKSLMYYRDEFNDAKLGMAAAYATRDYTLQAIADAFKVHYSTVSRAINDR